QHRAFSENLNARLRELPADEARERTADETGDDREDKVHRADVLMVRRIDPTLPVIEAGAVIFVMIRGVSSFVRHSPMLLSASASSTARRPVVRWWLRLRPPARRTRTHRLEPRSTRRTRRVAQRGFRSACKRGSRHRVQSTGRNKCPECRRGTKFRSRGPELRLP